MDPAAGRAGALIEDSALRLLPVAESGTEGDKNPLKAI
jgi:hypothetical protein